MTTLLQALPRIAQSNFGIFLMEALDWPLTSLSTWSSALTCWTVHFIHPFSFLLHLQFKERLTVSLFNQNVPFQIFESTPNWPLGLWPLAAKLWLLNIARYHYTQITKVWLWHWAGGWHGTPVTRPVRGRRKWKLRAEQWRADQWVRGQLGLRDPLSRLCSDNATLRLRVSLQSGHNVTAGLRCSQTFTFVAVSQTIYFLEFHWINAERQWF